MTADVKTSATKDEAAVRGLYEALMDGWNRGSGASFAAPFAEDAQFVAFDGTHLRGRGQIASTHQPLFDKWLKGTRLVGQVLSVRFLRPDVALILATGQTIMRGKTKPAPERDSIQTLLATKSEASWRLVAFQNTRLRPMGRSIRGTLIWLFTDWLWRLFRPRSYSTQWASLSSDDRVPASLSSGRMPGGMFSNKKVTSVPPSLSSKVTTMVIFPLKAGSSESKVTA